MRVQGLVGFQSAKSLGPLALPPPRAHYSQNIQNLPTSIWVVGSIPYAVESLNAVALAIAYRPQSNPFLIAVTYSGTKRVCFFLELGT